MHKNPQILNIILTLMHVVIERYIEPILCQRQKQFQNVINENERVD